MECEPTTGLFENGGSTFIGQSSPASMGTFVSPSGDDVGLPVGEEHRSSASADQISVICYWVQRGAARFPGVISRKDKSAFRDL